MTGIDLIKRYEGVKYTAYADPSTGGKPYTCGYGATKNIDGLPFKPGDKITAETAHLLLFRDTEATRKAIERDAFLRTLPDGCKEALLSLCYNIRGGVSNFVKSQCYKAIKNKDVAGVFHNWDWGVSQKNVALGLARRRADELKLFLASWK